MKNVLKKRDKGEMIGESDELACKTRGPVKREEKKGVVKKKREKKRIGEKCTWT